MWKGKKILWKKGPPEKLWGELFKKGTGPVEGGSPLPQQRQRDFHMIFPYVYYFF